MSRNRSTLALCCYCVVALMVSLLGSTILPPGALAEGGGTAPPPDGDPDDTSGTGDCYPDEPSDTESEEISISESLRIIYMVLVTI